MSFQDSHTVKVLIDYFYEMYAYQYPKTIGIMFVLWLSYLVTKIECTVDFGWIICHLAVAMGLTIQYYDQVNLRGWITLGLMTVWTLRLGGFLMYYRVIRFYADARYEKLGEGVKQKALFFLFQYELQAFLITLTSVPLYFVFRLYKDQPQDGLYRWNFWVMMVMGVIGIIGETIADQQL